MTRIEETFQKLHGRDEAALVGFVTGGDPSPEKSVEVAKALVRGGVDILELGIPFSDPIADGPTIQASSLRALKAGTTPTKVLSIAESLREECSNPIVLLTYFNPVFQMGVERFAKEAQDCGVDGVVVPDLPIEEAQEYREIMANHNLDTIFLAAPSTSPTRLEKILSATRGFLYVVSVFGVTGTRRRVENSTLEMTRTFSYCIERRVPLAVGFGISKPEHVKAIVQAGADAVIVGSAFVKLLEVCDRTSRAVLKRMEDRAEAFKKATRAD